MKESPIEIDETEAPKKSEHSTESAPVESTTKSDDVNFDEI